MRARGKELVKVKRGEERSHEEMVSILFPVGSDAGVMERELRAIHAAMGNMRHELLTIYDEGSNLPALDAIVDRPASMRLVKGMGKWEAGAIAAGIKAAAGDVVVMLNEEEGDPYEEILVMAKMVRQGDCAVVVGKRREPPRMRKWVVWGLAGMNARDVTTMFRAFDGVFLDGQKVESRERRVVGFELTVKAHQAGLHVEEVGSQAVKMERDDLRPYMHWMALVLQAPVFVWAVWLVMIGVALARAATVGRGDVWGHVDNVVMLAAAAFAMTLAVRRVRVRTRFADAFFSLVLLNPLLYGAGTLPFDKTLIATGVLGLMAGAIVAMKRDNLLRYFAVAGLAVVLTAISTSFVMVLPALVAWLIAGGFLMAKGKEGKLRTKGFAMMAAGEVGLVIFGLACVLEPAQQSPAPANLFASIAGFVDFPLLVLAIVMLGLGWRKGPHGTVPPHFAGMLALLVGLLTMLLNNFQEGSLARPGADQTVLVLCLVYTVFALHGPRRIQWLAPPLLLICAVVYTVFR